MNAWWAKAKQHMREPSMYARVAACVLFLLALVLLRHLAVFFLTFFILERLFAALGRPLSKVAWVLTAPLRRLLWRDKTPSDEQIAASKEKWGSALAIVLVLALVIGGSALLIRMGWHRLLASGTTPSTEGIKGYLHTLRQDITHTLPTQLQWIFEAGWHWLEGTVKKYGDSSTNPVDQLRRVGRILVQLAAGLVVAIIYRLDSRRVWNLIKAKEENSILGALQRYFRFAGEAVLLTIQLQVIVAVVNTVLTLPILLVLQLPRIDLLLMLVFLCSLVPILGNFVSGTVLIALSLLYRGWVGAVLFWAITLLLHKLETYYLNPRLGAKHVNLPMTLMVFSLVLFEHFLGVVGIFLSFPSLYVFMKIREDWKEARATVVGLSP